MKYKIWYKKHHKDYSGNLYDFFMEIEADSVTDAIDKMQESSWGKGELKELADKAGVSHTEITFGDIVETFAQAFYKLDYASLEYFSSLPVDKT